MTSRDRASWCQAISKAQETARSRGAAAAAELRKSLDWVQGRGLGAGRRKRALERRCDVLSREADALGKAYELLRDVRPAPLPLVECRGDGMEVRSM